MNTREYLEKSRDYRKNKLDNLTVHLNNDEFVVLGHGNWGPGNEIKPGPIAALMNARFALIAQNTDRIQAQSPNIYLALDGIQSEIDDLLQGIGDVDRRNNYPITGSFKLEDKWMRATQITTWQKAAGWGDHRLNLKLVFRFKREDLSLEKERKDYPVTYEVTLRYELEDWQKYVDNRRFSELAQHIYETKVLPYL